MKLLYSLGHGLFSVMAKGLFHYRVVHPERIPREGGVILAMNHQSFLDPPIAGIATDRDVFFLARKSLLDWPVVGPLLPKVNVIPVDTENPGRSALMTVIRQVRQGRAVLIFPEGERSWDGKLLPGQPGVGLVVAKTLAPVVPMRIFGSHEALPRGEKEFHLHPITVVVGQPMHFSGSEVKTLGKEAYKAISERIMTAIGRLQLPADGDASQEPDLAP